MTNISQSQPMNCIPFVPVLKTDEAEILPVHPRTIDNYIAQGLLPKPKQFGSREMWHPDVFYGHLSTALLGEGQPEVVAPVSEAANPREDGPVRRFAGVPAAVSSPGRPRTAGLRPHSAIGFCLGEASPRPSQAPHVLRGSPRIEWAWGPTVTAGSRQARRCAVTLDIGPPGGGPTPVRGRRQPPPGRWGPEPRGKSRKQAAANRLEWLGLRAGHPLLDGARCVRQRQQRRADKRWTARKYAANAAQRCGHPRAVTVVWLRSSVRRVRAAMALSLRSDIKFAARIQRPCLRGDFFASAQRRLHCRAETSGVAALRFTAVADGGRLRGLNPASLHVGDAPMAPSHATAGGIDPGDGSPPGACACRGCPGRRGRWHGRPRGGCAACIGRTALHGVSAPGEQAVGAVVAVGARHDDGTVEKFVELLVAALRRQDAGDIGRRRDVQNDADAWVLSSRGLGHFLSVRFRSAHSCAVARHQQAVLITAGPSPLLSSIFQHAQIHG